MSNPEENRLDEILRRVKTLEQDAAALRQDDITLKQNLHLCNEQVFTNALYLETILGILQGSGAAKSATLTFVDSKGNKLMPASIVVGQTATAVYTEWSGPSGTGTALPDAGAVTFTSSDPTNAPVDPNTGIVTGVGPTTAMITGTDATPINGVTFSASDTVTVSAVTPPPPPPVAAQSATLVLTANPLASKRVR